MTYSRETRFLRLRVFVSTKVSVNIACKYEYGCTHRGDESDIREETTRVSLVGSTYKLYYICTGKYELAPSSDESNDCNHVVVHKWRQGYPPRDINAAPRWARARPRRSLDLGPTRDRDLARCSQFPRLIHRRRVAVWCAWEENEGRCVLRA
jgi:hypothetical protein